MTYLNSLSQPQVSKSQEASNVACGIRVHHLIVGLDFALFLSLSFLCLKIFLFSKITITSQHKLNFIVLHLFLTTLFLVLLFV